jgi:hypothetical protein
MGWTVSASEHVEEEDWGRIFSDSGDGNYGYMAIFSNNGGNYGL